MLNATPGILRSLTAGLTYQQLTRKPEPDRFSIAEVFGHLADAELRTYTPRIRALCAGGNPAFPAYTPPDSFEREPDAALSEFETLRDENVAFLANVPAEALLNTGLHSRLGPMTLDNVLAEIAYHDLGHIKQVCELVRWLQFYPRMGPFQQESSVNP